MSRVFGTLELFEPVREDATAFYIGYELQKEADSDYYTWQQVTLWKKQIGRPTFEQVRLAVEADINAQTDDRILRGFRWTPQGSEQPIAVWLSAENQKNFSEAQRFAVSNPDLILPVTFKLGENEDGNPVYHQFMTAEELTAFYAAALAYVTKCLQEGWARKDGIDWTPYRTALQPVTD